MPITKGEAEILHCFFGVYLSIPPRFSGFSATKPSIHPVCRCGTTSPPQSTRLSSCRSAFRHDSHVLEFQLRWLCPHACPTDAWHSATVQLPVRLLRANSPTACPHASSCTRLPARCCRFYVHLTTYCCSRLQSSSGAVTTSTSGSSERPYR